MGSGAIEAERATNPAGCFNPSFGMDRVSTERRASGVQCDQVSIPRSGWIVFQPATNAGIITVLVFQSLVRDGSCFNVPFTSAEALLPVFQSLVRDGSCFNHGQVRVFAHRASFNPSFGMDRVSTTDYHENQRRAAVSIPRSGWIVFQRRSDSRLRWVQPVSIPRSGWIVFQLRHALRRAVHVCFNPSFGMDRVSTPMLFMAAVNAGVSIPRSGWIVFQLVSQDRVSKKVVFQSLVRDGSCFNSE